MVREGFHVVREECDGPTQIDLHPVDVHAGDDHGDRATPLSGTQLWQMHDYWFGEALGELRSGVVLQVAIIAKAFGLDVEDDLANVLPMPDAQDPREP